MHRITLLLFLLCGFSACTTLQPVGNYEAQPPPPAPDYSQSRYWAALPDQQDPADRVPSETLKEEQQTAEVDVFFLHPTTYTGSKKGEDNWNGPVDNESLNKKTDESTILHQASIFNGSGRVYAPRYRQAHLNAYFTKDQASAKAAFALAYQDAKAAFEYYLKHYNQGRPIIIASHSQGTTHGMELVREYFDEQDLQEKLVVAYLVGIPVPRDYFKNIRPCQRPEDLQCICSWRSWRRGYTPPRFDQEQGIIVTNPLIWTTDDNYADAQLNEGTVLRRFGKVKKGIADAQIHKSILWVNKPKFFGSIFLKAKNYHVGDFNLFYMNVRNNARRRVEAFLNRN